LAINEARHQAAQATAETTKAFAESEAMVVGEKM
jgi:hypothetical protein